MNSKLIQQFELYVNKKNKPWMYKILCIFGTKKFLRFQQMDRKHGTTMDMQYRTVYNNINDFLRKTKCPHSSLAVLRRHYIHELYLK